jgi:hypothetical protein
MIFLCVEVVFECYKYWPDFMIWKLMLKSFFDWYCVMHYSFIPEHITASEARYMEVLALM